MIYKKAQLTIFIIVAIIIVVAFALVFFFRPDIIPDLTGKGQRDARIVLKTCLEDRILEGANLIASQGGYIEPELATEFQFNGEELKNISFLCYNVKDYDSCISQEPMLISHLTQELEDYIEEDVRMCFDEMALAYEKQNSAVEARYRYFEITLKPGNIVLEIFGQLTLTKSGETTTEEDFRISIPSKFYDISEVVQEINAQEARFCNFDQLGYMIINPEFNIDKFRTGTATTIYTIEHRESKEKFRFAIRSCVMPGGI